MTIPKQQVDIVYLIAVVHLERSGPILCFVRHSAHSTKWSYFFPCWSNIRLRGPLGLWLLYQRLALVGPCHIIKITSSMGTLLKKRTKKSNHLGLVIDSEFWHVYFTSGKFSWFLDFTLCTNFSYFTFKMGLLIFFFWGSKYEAKAINGKMNTDLLVQMWGSHDSDH